MIIPKFEDFNSSNCKPRSLEIHYPDFYKMIVENYHCDTWNENLYWYYNNLTDYPRCKNCGNKTKFINLKEGYRKFCSKKCSNSNKDKQEKTKQVCIEKYRGIAPASSKEVQKKMKETNLERYGVGNAMQNKDISSRSQQTNIERYGGCGNASKELQKKYQQTMLKKYGVDNPMRSECIKEALKFNLIEKYGFDSIFKIPEIQNKISNICLERYGKERFNNPEQIKQTMLERYGSEGNFGRPEVKQKSLVTCIERYGDRHYNNQEKHKQTCVKKYGVENIMQIPGVLDKINETKRKNKTFNTSQIEELFKDYLEENNIEYIRQYKSEKYPFNCDFYIVKYDLYIEIQGNWTHGKRPYNPEKDNEIVELWKSKNTKFYNNAIEVWTIRDPLKRKIAKENNLRFLEIFSNNIDEVIHEYTRALERFGLDS